MLVFSLTVVGSLVLYRSRETTMVFESHRLAYRYLIGSCAHKIAGSNRCLSGLYLID